MSKVFLLPAWMRQWQKTGLPMAHPGRRGDQGDPGDPAAHRRRPPAQRGAGLPGATGGPARVGRVVGSTKVRKKLRPPRPPWSRRGWRHYGSRSGAFVQVSGVPLPRAPY